MFSILTLKIFSTVGQINNKVLGSNNLYLYLLMNMTLYAELKKHQHIVNRIKCLSTSIL